MVRPGPPAILPGTAPDGVVIHVYAVPSEQLLIVQTVQPGQSVEKLAEAAAELAWSRLHAEQPEADGVCLVAYDGDDGQRMVW